jgi:hypothetical protein
MSITVESKPPIVTVVAKLVPAKAIVKVPLEAFVLVTTMLVITVVVLEGTVYNKVLVVVVAAPRNSVFGVAVILKLSFF